jgi:hypothetical protein
VDYYRAKADIYTEIDRVTRFPSARQFFSYCRLVPGADHSAGRTRHRSGSKAGNRYLKLALSHAAIGAVQYHPEIRAFFKAKARKKPIPRLIGKPGVVPTMYLGPPRCEATARPQRCRAGEPIMVFGRHRVWTSY